LEGETTVIQNRMLVVTIVIGCALACLCPSATAQEEHQAPDPGLPRVYVIGDSISIQYGLYLEQYLRGFMEYSRKEEDSEAKVGLPEPHSGNGGDSSTVLRFVEAAEKSGGFGADILLLNCGLHDIKTNRETSEKQVPIDQYESNLKKILESAKRMGMAVVWVRTTPVDENVHNQRPNIAFFRFAADCSAYNEVADRVMNEAGVRLIDLHSFTNNIGGELFADHVHFPEPIREKQGAFIAGWLVAWWNAQDEKP
jgi:lysophospholipase L1-like esterase